MNKKTIHKKKYFQLFRLIFWVIFILFIILGFLGIFYEDDMPLVGFFWEGIIAIIYLLIKKSLIAKKII